MTIETAKSAVSMAVKHLKRESPGQSLGVIFFGGEPLLMRDLIVEMIRHC
jgi:sulfatase maturation enzyme AslB (radical SAM superfamily)